MYDTVLGRMLSPDNYVLDGEFTQDYNRYSYGRNNPVIYTDPDGNLPFLVFAAAAVIGGGSNLWSNWSKIKDFKQGLAYFVSGAVGGAVSVVNPYAGGAITAGGNLVTDLATGNLPKFDNAWSVAKYAGGLALDGVGSAGSGSLAKFGYSKLSTMVTPTTTVAITGEEGAKTIERFARASIDDIAFSSAAQYEIVVK